MKKAILIHELCRTAHSVVVMAKYFGELDTYQARLQYVPSKNRRIEAKIVTSLPLHNDCKEEWDRSPVRIPQAILSEMREYCLRVCNGYNGPEKTTPRQEFSGSIQLNLL